MDLLERHSKMQRLNRSTTARIDRKVSRELFLFTGLVIACLIGAFAVTEYARKIDAPVVVQNMTPCTVCHFPEVATFKTLNQYKAGLRMKRLQKLAEKDLLADLISGAAK